MNIYFFAITLIQLIVVSVIDIKTRKISNYWSLINIVLYPVLVYISPLEHQFQWQTLLISIIFLAIGFTLFVLKIMGGGDAKFLTTFILIVPTVHEVLFVEYLLYSTIIFGIFFFLKNFLLNIKAISQYLSSFYIQGAKKFFGTKFAYAPVILFAWCLIGLKLYTNYL